MRVPRPPQNSTTFMTRSGRIDDVDLGDGNDEAGPPFADVAHLVDDLVLQVPGQDEDVVGLGLVDGLDRLDRDVHAGREAAVLVGIAVDREVEEVGADAAVVEQRVALARRAVAADASCPAPWRDQERQQVALGAAHLLGEARIGLDLEEAALDLVLEQLADARRWPARGGGVRRDRPAASRRASRAPPRRRS